MPKKNQRTSSRVRFLSQQRHFCVNHLTYRLRFVTWRSCFDTFLHHIYHICRKSSHLCRFARCPESSLIINRRFSCFVLEQILILPGNETLHLHPHSAFWLNWPGMKRKRNSVIQRHISLPAHLLRCEFMTVGKQLPLFCGIGFVYPEAQTYVMICDVKLRKSL